MVKRRPEELCPGRDRAFVVAKKRGKAHGAKGGRKVEAGMTERRNHQPSIVPETAQQGGEIRARWAWVEPRVWTSACWRPWKGGLKEGNRFG